MAAARLPPVSRTLRIVVTWLLALALPLQGWAAASMLGCGPGHEPPAVQVMEGHGQHADHAHHHDDSDAAASTTSCSACAACCVGFALRAQAPQVAEPPAGQAAPVLPATTAVSFVTGGPERPPRAAFA